ncbi:hypothetical protein [Shewanella scandinavica]|uniref:hypothetical protein n=1 Tax=Shewanella scandinavica TaxID=3063538 RepID=UPI00319BF62D
MGLPVTIYRWDDAGAPQLGANPTPSEIIGVLKACLVTGYGAKAGLGWSVAFEDAGTSKIAFRNSTVDGSGGFIQYWSSTGTNAAGTLMYVRAASAMSALDSFTHPSYRFVHYNSASNSQWMVIGTSAGAYIIPRVEGVTTNYISAGIEVAYFIGDIHSNYPNDVTRCTICAFNFTADMVGVNYSHSLASGGTSGTGIMYGTDGNTKSFLHVIDVGSTSIQEQNVNLTLETSGINPVLYPALIRANATSYTDIDNIKCVFSNKNPFYRGVVPGLFAMPFAGYGNSNWPIEYTWGGVKYQLMRGFYNTMWVDVTEWY